MNNNNFKEDQCDVDGGGDAEERNVLINSEVNLINGDQGGDGDG